MRARSRGDASSPSHSVAAYSPGDTSGKSRSRGSISFKTILMLAIAATFAYFGFIGGDKLASSWLASSEVDEIAEKVNAREDNALEEDEEEEEAADLDLSLEYPQLLHQYYRKHNPKMMGDVPMILARYAGKEMELFAKLEKKYGDKVLGLKKMEMKMQENKVDDKMMKGMSKKVQVKDEDEEEEEEEDMGEEEEMEEEESESPSIKKVVAEEEEEVDRSRKWTSRKENENDYDGEEGAQMQQVDVEQVDENALPDQAFDMNQEMNDAGSSGAGGEGGRGHVSVIVIGFPGTGVDLVGDFLSKGLGFTMANPEEVALSMVQVSSQAGIPEFNMFDRFEGIADDTVSFFFEQMLATYPLAKVLVTVRDVEEWYDDFAQVVTNNQGNPHFLLRYPIYQQMLGSMTSPSSYLWKKMYSMFYERVLASIPRPRRSLVPVFGQLGKGQTRMDTWKWAAHFLKKDIQRGWIPPPLGVKEQRLRPVPSMVTDALSKLHLFDQTTPSGNGFLKVMVVGLEGSGIHAIAEGLKKLGFTVADMSGHCGTTECKKIVQNVRDVINGKDSKPKFGFSGVFHGVDAVVGSPADIFLSEALRSNPDLKVVLSIRNLDGWWGHTKCIFKKDQTTRSNGYHSRKSQGNEVSFRQLVYGNEEVPSQYVGKKIYYEHLDIVRTVPKDRLLVLDVMQSGGDSWRQLCDLLRVQKCSYRLSSTRFPMVETCSH